VQHVRKGREIHLPFWSGNVIERSTVIPGPETVVRSEDNIIMDVKGTGFMLLVSSGPGQDRAAFSCQDNSTPSRYIMAANF
jgi:hypothetical protein